MSKRQKQEKKQDDLYEADKSAMEGRNMEDMQDFLKSLDRTQLENYIVDMYWKGHKVSESELGRAFLARMRYDLDLVPKPIAKAVIHREPATMYRLPYPPIGSR